MPRYLIERTVPGAHKMTTAERREAANKSRDVLDHLGTGIHWEHSFISEDRITCVYVASDPEIIRKHARISGFPANQIREITGEMDPVTAEPRQPATVVTA